jgi:hypothetical protein
MKMAEISGATPPASEFNQKFTKVILPPAHQLQGYLKNFQPALAELIFLGYFLAVFLRSRFFLFLNFDLGLWLTQLKEFLMWLAGGFLGWHFLFLDKIVYFYFLHPELPSAQQAEIVMKNHGLKAWLKLMIKEKVEEKLTLRSLLFQLAFWVLAIFTVTSTASFLGKGLVMGLGLHLLIEEWQLQLNNPLNLNKRLFWQLKRTVSLEEQKYYLGITTFLFLFITLLI